ncbi:hypothetical protein [Haloarchaeobius iranensis]|uniref:Uncharacterized protein n=1 Tax=Haloarchaeobius iranensis TaxID=996166 RepID=A0A1G9U1D7_9EURY|nr:hypothetical protein [Haloarchaeobius iranensis]SDM53837.1 hypothetical protein SAMN05192554_103255 [Haloarchaeobius iranensis]
MTPEFLTELRADERRRVAATNGAVLLGVGLSLFHWSGLLLAGALASLPQRSIPRGIGAGFGVGVLAVIVFLGQLWLAGTLGLVLGMGQPTWLALGLGLGLPTVGALVRGVV